MWGLTLQFWQNVVTGANIAALALGILTAAAAAVSALVSSHIAVVVQQDADQRILEARTRGDEARADAAKANQRASEAAERAAALEQEAANADTRIADTNERAAKLANETEQLKAKNFPFESAISPRILEQTVTAKKLEPFSDISFRIVSPSDFEPKRTAGQIRFMLSV
jgi:septal ring factor EnvC (AmiA/AmiB activator)